VTKRVQGALAAEDIVIHGISVAPDGFDARFSPVSRTYEYRIEDAKSLKNPLHHAFTYRSPYLLDEASMSELGERLLGLHDWATFCRPKAGATTIRTLLHFSWSRGDEGVLIGTVMADAFCHSMVRSLVGAAVAVGRGKLTIEEVLSLRDAKERGSAWPTMPAQGLTLVSVAYPPEEELGARAENTRAKRDSTPD
jgi:tRNA pseudouridine38-40 synthase